MSKEISLQMSFGGELRDTRTRKQKRLTKQREGMQQAEMFSTREVAQWGVRRTPMRLKRPDGQPLRMKLEIEDPRTEEQKAADAQRAAQARTEPLPQLHTAGKGEVLTNPQSDPHRTRTSVEE